MKFNKDIAKHLEKQWRMIDTQQRLKRIESMEKVNKFIIKTNKGFLCERNDYAVYNKKNTVNEFYSKGFSGAFFNMANSNNDAVDMLGFTDDIYKAQVFLSCIGNRVQEIIDRINWGYEDITEIKIILKKGEDEVC